MSRSLLILNIFFLSACASHPRQTVSPQGSAFTEEALAQALLQLRGDERKSAFGLYDAAVVEAVQNRWYRLLEKHRIKSDGKVVVGFRLHADGRATEVTIVYEELDEATSALCQRAILDTAPYPPMPQEVRRLLGKNYREVRFTFHVNK
jgi:hypothetical protein